MDGGANWNEEKTNKSLNAHGVSSIAVTRDRHRHDDQAHHWRRPWDPKDSDWRVVRPSRYARRITGQTPLIIGDPAAADPRLRTSADSTGKLEVCMKPTSSPPTRVYPRWSITLLAQKHGKLR